MKKVLQICSLVFLMGVISGCDTQNVQEASATDANRATQESAQNSTSEQPDAIALQNDAGSSAEAEQAQQDGNYDAHSQNGGFPEDNTPAVTPAGWYMRTVVEAIAPDGTVYEHRTAGVFGVLDDSSDRRDRHDIESYGKAILQVVFVNNRVDIKREYFSDYRSRSGADAKQVWTFLVKNERAPDLSHADLKISVEKMHEVFRKSGSPLFNEKVATDQSKRQQLTLVDVDNQKVYGYDELQNTLLNMDGKHVRTFRWVLGGNVSSEDMEPRKVIDVVTTGGASSAPRPASLQAQGSHSKFGLPPE